MKAFFNFLLAGILFTSCGCSKENIGEQLPPATQIGANTFGCKVNGVVYSCKGTWDPKNFLITDGVYAYISENRLRINALIKKNIFHDGWNMTIDFDFIERKEGIYTNNIKFQGQETYPDYESKIEITKFDNNMVAGKFQLKFQFENNPTRTYEFTEGRFDIKLKN